MTNLIPRYLLLLVVAGALGTLASCSLFKTQDVPLTQAESDQIAAKVRDATGGKSVAEALQTNNADVLKIVEGMIGAQVKELRVEVDGTLTAKLPPLVMEAAQKAIASAGPAVAANPTIAGVSQAALGLAGVLWSVFRIRYDLAQRKKAAPVPAQTPAPIPA